MANDLDQMTKSVGRIVNEADEYTRKQQLNLERRERMLQEEALELQNTITEGLEPEATGGGFYIREQAWGGATRYWVMNKKNQIMNPGATPLGNRQDAEALMSELSGQAPGLPGGAAAPEALEEFMVKREPKGKGRYTYWVEDSKGNRVGNTATSKKKADAEVERLKAEQQSQVAQVNETVVKKNEPQEVNQDFEAPADLDVPVDVTLNANAKKWIREVYGYEPGTARAKGNLSYKDWRTIQADIIDNLNDNVFEKPNVARYVEGQIAKMRKATDPSLMEDHEMDVMAQNVASFLKPEDPDVRPPAFHPDGTFCLLQRFRPCDCTQHSSQ